VVFRGGGRGARLGNITPSPHPTLTLIPIHPHPPIHPPTHPPSNPPTNASLIQAATGKLGQVFRAVDQCELLVCRKIAGNVHLALNDHSGAQQPLVDPPKHLHRELVVGRQLGRAVQRVVDDWDRRGCAEGGDRGATGATGATGGERGCCCSRAARRRSAPDQPHAPVCRPHHTPMAQPNHVVVCVREATVDRAEEAPWKWGAPRSAQHEHHSEWRGHAARRNDDATRSTALIAQRRSTADYRCTVR